jgi:hypothetical protein
VALEPNGGSAKPSIHANETPPARGLRWWTIAWTIALCAGCVVLPKIMYDQSVDALATPETAMYGPARFDAGLSCAVPYLAAMALLGLATLKHSFSKRTRALAVLPALTLLPVYAAHLDMMDRIEAVPAFHHSFVLSECDLDRLADAIESGEAVSLPALVGRFEIIRGEKLDDGAVVLYTKERKISEDREELWGFVRKESLGVDTGRATTVGLTGQVGKDHSVERLSGRWYVLYHHYWFIKRGWS